MQPPRLDRLPGLLCDQFVKSGFALTPSAKPDAGCTLAAAEHTPGIVSRFRQHLAYRWQQWHFVLNVTLHAVCADDDPAGRGLRLDLSPTQSANLFTPATRQQQ
jgi:hypothetical protein